MRPRAALLAATLMAAPLAAPGHPHVWIEAELGLVFDDGGRVTAIEVSWRYDPDTSDVLIEDRGYGLAGGALSAADLADFAGTDVNWAYPGFEGDLYLAQDGAPIALGPPEAHRADYARDQFITRHRRPLAQPVDASQMPLEIKVYDPTFWTVYTQGAPVRLPEGVPCRATVTPPDLEAANETLMALLSAHPQGVMAEVDFPPVGEFYADTITVTCGAAG